MANKVSCGWQKMSEGYHWVNCDGCYPVTAYSEVAQKIKLVKVLFSTEPVALYLRIDKHILISKRTSLAKILIKRQLL